MKDGKAMTEIQALMEIANAIRMLAAAVAGLGLIFWVMTCFKKMG